MQRKQKSSLKPSTIFPYLYAGAATLSGTSGFTSITTRNSSSTTLSPDFPPTSLIFCICSSASVLASSSAFLLPLVCYHHGIRRRKHLASLATACIYIGHGKGRTTTLRLAGNKGADTSFSNFLNSSSFCLRYSSISFWASERASLTRLVRSTVVRKIGEVGLSGRTGVCTFSGCGN